MLGFSMFLQKCYANLQPNLRIRIVSNSLIQGISFVYTFDVFNYTIAFIHSQSVLFKL